MAECLEEDKRHCREEGDKTLELFPLHPEGRWKGVGKFLISITLWFSVLAISFSFLFFVWGKRKEKKRKRKVVLYMFMYPSAWYPFFVLFLAWKPKCFVVSLGKWCPSTFGSLFDFLVDGGWDLGLLTTVVVLLVWTWTQAFWIKVVKAVYQGHWSPSTPTSSLYLWSIPTFFLIWCFQIGNNRCLSFENLIIDFSWRTATWCFEDLYNTYIRGAHDYICGLLCECVMIKDKWQWALINNHSLSFMQQQL